MSIDVLPAAPSEAEAPRRRPPVGEYQPDAHLPKRYRDLLERQRLIKERRDNRAFGTEALESAMNIIKGGSIQAKQRAQDFERNNFIEVPNSREMDAISQNPENFLDLTDALRIVEEDLAARQAEGAGSLVDTSLEDIRHLIELLPKGIEDEHFLSLRLRGKAGTSYLEGLAGQYGEGSHGEDIDDNPKTMLGMLKFAEGSRKSLKNKKSGGELEAAVTAKIIDKIYDFLRAKYPTLPKEIGKALKTLPQEEVAQRVGPLIERAERAEEEKRPGPLAQHSAGEIEGDDSSLEATPELVDDADGEGVSELTLELDELVATYFKEQSETIQKRWNGDKLNLGMQDAQRWLDTRINGMDQVLAKSKKEHREVAEVAQELYKEKQAKLKELEEQGPYRISDGGERVYEPQLAQDAKDLKTEIRGIEALLDAALKSEKSKRGESDAADTFDLRAYADFEI